MLTGILDNVYPGGYVHLVIDDDLGHFTWISTVSDFLITWIQFDLEKDP